MLTVTNLNTCYGAIQVHWNVGLTVAAGECVGLLGPNGAGKSTLVKVISGLMRSPGAKIEFLGEDISKLTPRGIVERGLVHVPEGRRIFADLSVRENLMIAARSQNSREMREDIDWVLDLFPALVPLQPRSGGALSGGQQQMLAVGRGLMARPKLLMLDEPSLGLSPLMVETLYANLHRIREDRKIGLLLVEQNVAAIRDIASRMVVLRAGHVVAEADPKHMSLNELHDLYTGAHDHAA